uniref:Uncharacterized protein n=1 Tax=Hyaloperonospora arabidopsidis (strain Emoy2) TaxID=559515 RepID=M4BRH4_HYAAE
MVSLSLDVELVFECAISRVSRECAKVDPSECAQGDGPVAFDFGRVHPDSERGSWKWRRRVWTWSSKQLTIRDLFSVENCDEEQKRRKYSSGDGAFEEDQVEVCLLRITACQRRPALEMNEDRYRSV